MVVGVLLDRAEIAGGLQRAAARPGLAGRRDELEALARALEGHGDPGPWAELDLLHAFVRPESVPAAGLPVREARAWALVEVGIGALVFVPLLVTWFGLMRATSAYQALIGTDASQAGRPFLQLWQTGFDGRLGGWATFGHVAAGASAVIALLLVLSLVHGLRRAAVARREAEAARAGEELLAELAPLLTRAQAALHDHRRASPQRFAAELTGAAQTLARLLDEAADTQRDLSRAADTVRTAVAAADGQLAAVKASVDPLRTAVDGVERAAGRVEQAVAAGADRLVETVRDASTATDGLVDRGGRRMTDAAEAVRTSTEGVSAELAAAALRVEESVLELAAAQRGFTTGTELAADVTGRMVQRLDDVVLRVAALGDHVARAADAALAAARHADDASRGVAAEVAGLLAGAATAATAAPSAGPDTRTPAPDTAEAREHPGAPAAAPGTSTLDLTPAPARQASR
ncbi:methyl-accepting chemotaxis protein [Kitasatospora sp. NPDC059571]|uniref:methyl-accepting chemotaxis protein n=1 Tax=Kitasatospora sp. NPDC059571 TaxID=3346871 RepID=UPI003686FC74